MLLSIIVPVHNAGRWLRECLDSLLGQSVPNFELLIVDDGSTDGSGAICDEYAARDGRIRVIRQDNAGVSGARNAALALAHGDYLTFADADDVAHPELVRCVQGAAEATSADLLWWKWREFSEYPQLPPIGEPNLNETPARDLIWDIIGLPKKDAYMGYVWNKAFRREILRGIRFDGEIDIWEDMLFCAAVLAASDMNAKCVGLNCQLYAYRQHADSASRQFSNKTTHMVVAADRICEMLKPLPVDSARRVEFINEMLRNICDLNRMLLKCRVENRRREWRRLDAVWRKYEHCYVYDRRWTRGFFVFRYVQKLCAFCRGKGVWLWY